MVAEELNESVPYGWYVVALVDILGQKEAIRRLAKLEPGTSERAEITKAIKDSLGVRDTVCNVLRSSFNLHATSGDKPEGGVLSSEQQTAHRVLSDAEIKTYFFGDTVVAYAALAATEGHLRVSAIRGMLAALAGVMLTSLAFRIPLRGAIEIDLGLEPKDGEVYGPAFLAAYELEQHVAQYPRIIAGPRLFSFLADRKSRPGATASDGAMGLLAKSSWNLLGRDEDGCYIVDYLGEAYRNLLSGLPAGTECVEKGLAFAREQHDRFISEGNPKLAGRYSSLRRYFEYRAPAWRPET